MMNQFIKLAVITSFMVITPVFAAPEIAGTSIDVHFYVGDSSADKQMTISNFNAVGDTDCTVPTSGPGICKAVLLNSKILSTLTMNHPMITNIWNAFKLTSADPNDNRPTGSLTISFNAAIGSNSFPVSYSFTGGTKINEGIFPGFYIGQLPNTGSAKCDFLVTPALSAKSRTSITFSCID